MEVAQGFADRHPLVALGQACEHLVGELQVEPGGAALIGPGRLGGGPHRIAAEQIGQAGVLLPKAQQAHQPGGPAEEGVQLQAGAAPKQVVAAAAAFLAQAQPVQGVLV